MKGEGDMKKLLLVSLILLIIPLSAAAGSISIISPTGQTEWMFGTNQEIRWQVHNVSKRMKITLWKAKKYVGVIADDIVPPPPQIKSAELSYKWQVGKYVGGKVKPGEFYQIKIVEKGTSAHLASNQYASKISEENDKYFTIKAIAHKGTFAHAKFWDFELTSIEITLKGKAKIFRAPDFLSDHGWGWSSEKFYVPYNEGLGPPLNIRVHIKMKTPPKKNITKADIDKWGLGNRRLPIYMDVSLTGFPVEDSLWIPSFSEKDVESWPEAGKVFETHFSYIIDAWRWYHCRIGKNLPLLVELNRYLLIPETKENNNSNNSRPPYIFLFYDYDKAGKPNEGPWDIDIKSPGLHCKWLWGTRQKIKWVAKGVSKRMKLTLYKDKVYIGVIADNILPPPPTANSKTLTRIWRVGDYIGGRAKAGDNYQIRVEEKGKPASSSHYFEILALKKLKKMKPKSVPQESAKKTDIFEKTMKSTTKDSSKRIKKPKKVIKKTIKISPTRERSK